MNKRLTIVWLVAAMTAALSVLSPRAADADGPSGFLVPEDTCTLELQLPSGTTATIDGRDYGEKRRLEFKKLLPGKIYSSQLTVRFPDENQEQRTLLMNNVPLICWFLD